MMRRAASDVASIEMVKSEDRFDPRQLTWAGSFDRPRDQSLVRLVENLTGKLPALRLIQKFARRAPSDDCAIWSTVLDVMGIEVTTPRQMIEAIPREGPVVVLANHPTGPLDGVVLAWLVSQVRNDYKVLARELAGMRETGFGRYLIPVPFWSSPTARADGLRMRGEAMQHLSAGGALAYFPAGGVATSRSRFGPVEEGDWTVFTAKLIRDVQATVVPVHFPRGPSRLFRAVNGLSPVLRQGLLMHEAVRQRGRRQSPVIGAPIPPEAQKGWADRPREAMAWLREHTLSL